MAIKKWVERVLRRTGLMFYNPDNRCLDCFCRRVPICGRDRCPWCDWIFGLKWKKRKK